MTPDTGLEKYWHQSCKLYMHTVINIKMYKSNSSVLCENPSQYWYDYFNTPSNTTPCIHITMVVDGPSQLREVFDDFHFILANKDVIRWLVITWQQILVFISLIDRLRPPVTSLMALTNPLRPWISSDNAVMSSPKSRSDRLLLSYQLIPWLIIALFRT